jgi:phosphoglucan, water dikinase
VRAQVRALLVDGLSSGLRNDAADDALAMRQRWRLAELRCEDFAFVLTSRFLNLLDAAGGAETLATAHEKAWALPAGALVLAARHVGLSGWRVTECHALDEELSAWQKAGLAGSRVRLAASLLPAASRCRHAIVWPTARQCQHTD